MLRAVPFVFLPLLLLAGLACSDESEADDTTTPTATVAASATLAPTAAPTATAEPVPTATPSATPVDAAPATGGGSLDTPPVLTASAGATTVTLGEGSYCWTAPGGPGLCVDKVELPPSDAPLPVSIGDTVSLAGIDWTLVNELSVAVVDDDGPQPLAVLLSGGAASFTADLAAGEHLIAIFLRTQGNDASYGLLLSVEAGGAGTVPDRVTPSEPFTLAVGDRVSIDHTTWSLAFEAVIEDSRCPANVECIWAGQAVLAFRATSGGTSKAFTITLGSETMVPEPINDVGLFLMVSELRPYPLAGTPISPGARDQRRRHALRLAASGRARSATARPPRSPPPS